MRIVAFSLAALGLAILPARADGEPPGAPQRMTLPSGWVYQFTPYGWLPWVSGDAIVAGRSFEVQQNPVQVIEHLRMVWMSYMQAKNGPLTLFNDTIYADLGQSSSLVRSRRFSPHVTGTIGLADTASYRYWTVEAGAMYEVIEFDSGFGSARGPDTVVEVLAGGRYWNQELDVTFDVAGTVNFDRLTLVSASRALAQSGNVDWIDPFIGARLRFSPATGQEIALRGDVGGFGAGSKFTWQALATYSWFLCQQGPLTLDGYAGWRALSVDYEQRAGTSRYEFDVLQQGPVLGVTGRF